MASNMAIIWCVMVLMAVCATAETYNVGDELNWGIPPSAGDAYRLWPQTKNFEFGDTIVFNWTGSHNVVRVSRQDYDDCTFNNRIGAIQMSSPANFTIDNNGTSYYLCTVDRHCNGGMKVAITVRTSDSSHTITTTTTTLLVLFTLIVSMLSFM